MLVNTIDAVFCVYWSRTQLSMQNVKRRWKSTDLLLRQWRDVVLTIWILWWWIHGTHFLFAQHVAIFVGSIFQLLVTLAFADFFDDRIPEKSWGTWNWWMDGGHGVICRCVGYYGEEDAPSWRLARPLVFCRTPGACPLENGYARPVEGIHVLVDMRQMKVKSWTNLYAIFAESLLALNIFSVGIIINPSSLQSNYLWVRYVSELLLYGKNLTVTNAFVDMHAGDWVWG
jgi:hypothetical protein